MYVTRAQAAIYIYVQHIAWRPIIPLFHGVYTFSLFKRDGDYYAWCHLPLLRDMSYFRSVSVGITLLLHPWGLVAPLLGVDCLIGLRSNRYDTIICLVCSV